MNKLLERIINWVYTYIYCEDQFEHIVLEQGHCGDCGHHHDLVNGRCVSCIHTRNGPPIR